MASRRGTSRDNRPRWKRHARLFLAIGCVSVLVGLFCWYAYHDCCVPEDLEAAIQRSLPVGSTKDQVERWLERRRIRVHYYRPLLTRADYHEQDHFGVPTGTAQEGVIVGFIAEHNNCLAMAAFRHVGHIYLVFFLDKDGKLASHVVDTWVTSL